jgi:uncharacterized protein (DUF1697 family)
MAKNNPRFLALLRGINVGGKNVIAKDDLRQCFEDLGFTSVRTYIQSGNILFRSETSSVKELTAAVEAGLSDRFSYEAQVVILPQRKYKSAVAAAPDGWGTDDKQKHNAMFTLSSTTPKKVLAQLPVPKTGIETVTTGPGVIFWSASKSHLTKTTMLKLAKETAYQQMTVRNHNTVFKLLELFEEI